MEQIRAVCFTGHRELPEKGSPAYLRLVTRTVDAILRAMERGAVAFYCGGAPGYDLLCGELVLHLKERFPQMELHLILPFEGFEKRFSPEDQRRAAALRQGAAQTLVLSPHYYRGCMAVRNRALVAHAQLCLAYLTHAPSGTAQTVSFARKQGLALEMTA